MDGDYKKISSLLQSNQLDLALELTKDQLKQLPTTEFHKIIEINWLPLAEPLALYIDKFYKSAHRAIKSVAALYCEMNAFTINCDNWVVQFFAYSKFMGTEDFDWLADYNYTKDTALVFTDLENIQLIFKDYLENEKWKDKNIEKAFELSEYLIILGVQQLFREANAIAKIKKFKWATIPLFINAHDYDDLIFNATTL